MTPLNKMDVLGLLQEHGAPVYVQTALVLQYPHVAQKLAKAIVAKFPQEVDVVISPGMVSGVLAQEVARAKKCRSIFTERNNGTVSLRRDYRLQRGERALVVEDVLTTGRLTAEIVSLAQAYGLKVLGVGAIVDRSISGLCLPVPIRTLISYPMEHCAPDECGQCRAGMPLTDASKSVGASVVEGE
jgi:orotate phosphoribosyltransferase